MVALALLFACSGDKHQEELDEQYQLGYENGQNEGYEAGSSSGYDSGYAEGASEGYDSGLEEGYDSGYSEGYDDGYEEATGSLVDFMGYPQFFIFTAILGLPVIFLIKYLKRQKV